MKSRNKDKVSWIPDSTKLNCSIQANLAATNLAFGEMQHLDAETEAENARMVAEKASILANESNVLFNIEASKFDPKIYANFQLGSNSSTLDISPGQWV